VVGDSSGNGNNLALGQSEAVEAVDPLWTVSDAPFNQLSPSPTPTPTLSPTSTVSPSVSPTPSPNNTPLPTFTPTSGVATTTATAEPDPTLSPAPGSTTTAVPPTTFLVPTATPSATPTPTGEAGSVVVQILQSSDDVNEDDNSFTSNSGTVWLGNGASSDASFTGLRFSKLSIPAGSHIFSAKLRVYSVQDSWIDMKMVIAAEATGNSQTFTTANLPSQRNLSSNRMFHSSSTQWLASTWYDLDEMAPVVQEIVSRSDWQSGNSLSFILKGNGGGWGRKFVQATEGSASSAVQLIVTYN
jgi:hypothetical protein